MPKEMTSNNLINDKIHTIRGRQVMLDNDLAELYEVETKNLNRAVKRNYERFPESFMFQLSKEEFGNLMFRNGTSRSEENWKSQIVTLNNPLRFQNGTLEKSRGEHRKYLPYAFTEQGVAMLSGILKSKTAINISIQIIEAFISMRRFIQSNAQLFQRLDNIERKQVVYDKKLEEVFKAIEDRDIKPNKGIFFDGQVFDAHLLVSDIIRRADRSIILLDNYIDESVLILFNKRKKGVNVTIFTKNITDELRLDLKKYNTQYGKINVEEFNLSHDRFLIIDDQIYHFGASLKDLGKNWFAFSRFENESLKILDRIRKER